MSDIEVSSLTSTILLGDHVTTQVLPEMTLHVGTEWKTGLTIIAHHMVNTPQDHAPLGQYEYPTDP